METKFVSKHLGREIKEEAKTMDNIEEEPRRGRTGVRRVKVKKKKQRPNRFRHGSYLGSELLYSFLTELDAQYDTMSMENIGKTGEGRDVKIVKINANNSDLPVIFIDAGIHAREWISPAATLFLIEKLARQISKGRGKNDIAKYQWHIIPLANPDGYEYTRSHNR